MSKSTLALLREAQTKNFKIVCECGTVFKVKQIQDLKIKFFKRVEQAKTDKQSHMVPVDLVAKCGKILESYGCSKEESLEIITKAYTNSPTNNALELVKSSLKLLEINNV